MLRKEKMIKIGRQTHFILLISVLLLGCRQSISTIGTIEIDADKPVLHDGKLPIGITLGGKSIRGKDLLSPNILINSTFELAPRLENCKYDASRQLLTTPNGYATRYPMPESLFGWELHRGFASVQRSDTPSPSNRYYLSIQPGRDSLQRADVTNTATFSTSDTAYTFEAKIKCSNDSASISVFLTDTTLTAVSNIERLQASKVWRSVSTVLSPNKVSQQTRLMIRVQGRGAIDMDDVKLLPKETKLSYNLSNELLSLVREFDPGFVRFPDGRTANGFFVGTYPEWTEQIDTDQKSPMWTLNQQEYTGEFGLKEFLSLSKHLRKPPILISNIGITDRGALSRAENIKLLDDRVASHLRLGAHILGIYNISKDSAHLIPAIQPGYDMTSYDYFRRFKIISDRFRDNGAEIDLISAGDMTNFQKFSNYVFDVPSRSITSPELSAIVPTINDNETMLRQPIMLGECHFTSPDSSLFIPALVLRASFLINAENQGDHLRGLTIAPLLAESDDEKTYPLIHVDGGRYMPTVLYHLMKAFITMRGPALRALNEHTPRDLSGWSPLYTSLTSSTDNKSFFLKAVNTTRHPLPYKMTFKGKNCSPYKVKSIHFVSKGETTTTDLKTFDDYAIQSEETSLNTTRKEWQYTFKPYEIVFFEFVSR